LCLSESSAPLIPWGTFFPPARPHKWDCVTDNRWVDKGTVITLPPSFAFQRGCATVSLVSDKTAKR
ncbi:hypothetical protein AVEN_71757-1, partial [Araneus ventricosus]